MPRGRYQQQQWDRREQAILTALGELSAARGFATVTMDDLADAVGISKATLYQHFDSKDTMLIALIQQQTAQFLDWLAGTADQSPVARLTATMRYLMDSSTTPLRGLIQVGRQEILPVFESNTALMDQHADTLAQLIAIVREGQQRGEIASDLAPEAVISALWALSNVSLRANDSLQPPHAMIPHEVFVTQMVTLFERSIRPTTPRRDDIVR